MQKVIMVKLTVTFDSCPDQAPDTFYIPEQQHTDVEVKLLEWKEDLITVVFNHRKILNQWRVCD